MIDESTARYTRGRSWDDKTLWRLVYFPQGPCDLKVLFKGLPVKFTEFGTVLYHAARGVVMHEARAGFWYAFSIVAEGMYAEWGYEVADDDVYDMFVSTTYERHARFAMLGEKNVYNEDFSLTSTEKRLLEDIADVYNSFCYLPKLYENDLRDVALHVDSLSRIIAARLAVRVHPDLFTPVS